MGEARPTKAARLWAAACQGSGVLGVIGFPMLLLPFITMLVADKRRSSFIYDHTRQALFFQVLMTLITRMWFILNPTRLADAHIVFAVVFALVTIALLIFPVCATIQAFKGRAYDYPVLCRM